MSDSAARAHRVEDSGQTNLLLDRALLFERDPLVGVDEVVIAVIEEVVLLAENYSSAGIECGVASVGLVSESVLERKEFRDYTGNNINHPNDFFCRGYAQTIFKALIGYENLAD